MSTLIIESGSTKSDFVLFDTKTKIILQQGKSLGINPSLHTSIEGIFTEECLEMIRTAEVVYYYGSGVVGDKSKKMIETLLLPYNDNIHIEDDLLGACRGSFKDQKGVLGILGTGCNSCYYDGKKVSPGLPSLGYVLGDEGAGVDIGKSILKSYFYNKMPEDIRSKFEETYRLTREDVLENIYRKNGANKYLASYTVFLNEVQGNWKDDIIKSSFSAFVREHFLVIPNVDKHNITFIGSIAFVFQDYLKQICASFSLKEPQILKSPLEGLIEYHSIKKI